MHSEGFRKFPERNKAVHCNVAAGGHCFGVSDSHQRQPKPWGQSAKLLPKWPPASPDGASNPVQLGVGLSKGPVPHAGATLGDCPSSFSYWEVNLTKERIWCRHRSFTNTLAGLLKVNHLSNFPFKHFLRALGYVSNKFSVIFHPYTMEDPSHGACKE